MSFLSKNSVITDTINTIFEKTNRLLAATTTTYINTKNKTLDEKDIDKMINNDKNNPNSIENFNHPDNLYLLVLNLLIFIALFFLAYHSLKAVKKKLGRENDQKIKIANGFVFANGVRAFSLIIVILLENNSGDSPTAWINYLAHVVPSMMFLSGYMGLVNLLVEYYYLFKNQSNHLVNLILRVIVVFGYFLIAMIALISFAFQSFKSFAYNSEFVIGVVYIAIGTMFVYYGNKIVAFLRELNKYEVSETAPKVSFIIY